MLIVAMKVFGRQAVQSSLRVPTCFRLWNIDQPLCYGRRCSGVTIIASALAEEPVPGKVRGRGKGSSGTPAIKKSRTGKGLNGSLLWTELSAEERAAAGDGSWIRWEPLPAAPTRNSGSPSEPLGPPGRLFQLFSVDVETVDFSRASVAYPRPEKARLVEVAAVDLGLFGAWDREVGPHRLVPQPASLPVQSAADGTAAAVGSSSSSISGGGSGSGGSSDSRSSSSSSSGGGGGHSYCVPAGGGGGGEDGGWRVVVDTDRTFSTLVNCQRSFSDARTAAHNGITYAEVSRPGVPSTAAALQQFFGFIQRRCQETAAAVAAEAAVVAEEAEATQASRAGAGSGPAWASEPPPPPPPQQPVANTQPAAVVVVPVLMAHNGTRFDFPVLRAECGRVGVEWPQDWWYLDTLTVARCLWPKADSAEATSPPPTATAAAAAVPTAGVDPGVGGQRAGGAAVSGVAAAGGATDEDEEGLDGEVSSAGSGRGGRRSLSMEALKAWAAVDSSGKAHRALVDSLDLAEVWRALYGRFGRPSLAHLEQLRGTGKEARTAAGPMRSLGLDTLAARADTLVRHMDAAVQAVLSPPSHSPSPPPLPSRAPLGILPQRAASVSKSPSPPSPPTVVLAASDGHTAGASWGHQTTVTQPTTAPTVPAQPPQPRVVTVAQFRHLLAEGRVRLERSGGGGGGGGGGSFWYFNVKRAVEREAEAGAAATSTNPASAATAAIAVSSSYPSAAAAPATGSYTAGCSAGPHPHPHHQPPSPSPSAAAPLESFALLLPGVKLRDFPHWKWSDKDPRVQLVFCHQGSSRTGTRAEGAASEEDVAELVRLLDGLAEQAAREALGDTSGARTLFSCGRQPPFGTSRKPRGIEAQLHSRTSPGPAPGQLIWEPLATLSRYDKSTASYLPLPWGATTPFTVPGGGGGGSGGGFTGAAVAYGGGGRATAVYASAAAAGAAAVPLEWAKQENLAAVARMLPDVASSELVDVAVSPKLVWVNNKGYGTKLVVLHIARR